MSRYARHDTKESVRHDKGNVPSLFSVTSNECEKSYLCEDLYNFPLSRCLATLDMTKGCHFERTRKSYCCKGLDCCSVSRCLTAFDMTKGNARQTNGGVDMIN